MRWTSSQFSTPSRVAPAPRSIPGTGEIRMSAHACDESARCPSQTICESAGLSRSRSILYAESGIGWRDGCTCCCIRATLIAQKARSCWSSLVSRRSSPRAWGPAPPSFSPRTNSATGCCSLGRSIRTTAWKALCVLPAVTREVDLVPRWTIDHCTSHTAASISKVHRIRDPIVYDVLLRESALSGTTEGTSPSPHRPSNGTSA